jgi:hypothetical protein
MALKTARAQFYEDPLQIYGYAQSIYLNKKVAYTILNDRGGLPPVTGGIRNDAFLLQQVNLFLVRPINDQFSFFMNTEFTASYNTKLGTGDMNIEEAWVRYRPRDEFQVKAGLLIPAYNNLNEIRNRFPLFPYIIRPMVYEAFLEQLFQPSDYLPQRAFLQISGITNISSKMAAEYAVYMGNLESDYNATRAGTGTGSAAENNSIYRGEELSLKSMYGARIGLKSRNERFKSGFSFTHDYDFRQTVSTFSLARFPIQQIPILGDVERFRYGADLSFSAGPVQFEAEYIRVDHRDTDLMKLLKISLDKDFFYGNLTWNVSPTAFVYGQYSFMRNAAFEYVMPNSPDYKGLNVASIGGGYRFNDAVVLKAQGAHAFVGSNPYIDIKTTFGIVGISVIF